MEDVDKENHVHVNSLEDEPVSANEPLDAQQTV